MLKLESYLSPFLLSYLSKYVKDIESKDLQFSLWGGDAVLHNLQFKLDALDNELHKAPFSFVSCHAQELRIHVPWSKLASEPVVISLNTMECALKLNYKKKPMPSNATDEQKDTTTSQSSYINSLLTKIKNNVTININNLILKYVEDDIVLSVNVQSATLNSVNELWTPAFVDITEDNLVLRRVLKLEDTTVCLDRRGASGLVESFEDPLLYHTHIVFRQHTTYPTHMSRKPSVTKLNAMIEYYELNISENQFPALIHLIQLCSHIYYGRINITQDDIELEDKTDNQASNTQGWASWAWSYVPPVLSYDVPENEVKFPIFSFGFYIKNIKIKFKPSKKGSARQFHSSQNISVKPLIEIFAEGLSLEMLSRGLDFFSCDVSLCKGSVVLEDGTAYKFYTSNTAVPDFEHNTLLLASCGGSLVGFAADSLFDFRSPENNATLFEYDLSKEAFNVRKNQHETDAFYSQYLYIAEDARDINVQDEMEFNEFLENVDMSNIDQWKNIHEESWKRFVIGGESCFVMLSSYSLSCIDILMSWANDHNLKPYSLSPEKSLYTSELVKDVDFVPVRNTDLVVKNLTVAVPALLFQEYHCQEKVFNRITVTDDCTYFHPHSDRFNAKLPTVIIKVPAVTLTLNQPMYGSHFAAYLSQYLSPVSHLVDACACKYVLKLQSVECYLWLSNVIHITDCQPQTDLMPLVVVKDVLVNFGILQGQEYWKKRSNLAKKSSSIVLGCCEIHATEMQLQMLGHVIDSWMNIVSKSTYVKDVVDISLLESQLKGFQNSIKFNFVLKNFTMQTKETFVNLCLCGQLNYCDMFLTAGCNALHPIMQCSYQRVALCKSETFFDCSSFSKLPQDTNASCNGNTDWFSFYIQMPIDSNGSGCVLLTVNDIFFSINPYILNFFSHMLLVDVRKLLPVLFAPKKHFNTNASDNLRFYEKLERKLAFQIKSKGINLLIVTSPLPLTAEMCKAFPASLALKEQVTETSSNALWICLPEVKAFTTGFKTIEICRGLFEQDIQISNFTEFGTLNFALEHATIYTTLFNGKNYDVHYIIMPSAAACTLAFKQGKDFKKNVVVHLDLEPIDLKVSKSQIELLVHFFKLFETMFQNAYANCFVEMSSSDVASRKEKLTYKASEGTLHQSTNQELNKKDVDGCAGVQNSESNSFFDSFSLWLQCTLPRFSLSVYCNQQSKTVLCIDDVSLSLDFQSVYLKLMSSFTACCVTSWTKSNDHWYKHDLRSCIFSPMFSVLPAFVQKYEVQKQPKQKLAPTISEAVSKQGKFFDVTFTQALASDYHRNIQEDDNVDLVESSVTSAAESVTCMKRNISELICSIQAFDLLMNPDLIGDACDVFFPLLNVYWRQHQNLPHSSTGLPILHFSLAGARIFLPSNLNDTYFFDDLLMFCFSRFEINPQPQNPLSRLIVSSTIYQRANAAGLLHCTGSLLEDRQFEIYLEDVSFGTASSSDVVSFLKRPVHCENPALEWNLSGGMFSLSEPVFHPVFEQFDIQAVIAPSIWHQISSAKSVIVCGPSVEINVMTDIILHLTIEQLSIVLKVCDSWTMQYDKMRSKLEHDAGLGDPILSCQNDDSGLSVGTSSQGSGKTIISSKVKFIGDCLLTGQRIKLLVYQFLSDDAVIPCLHAKIHEPSFAFHVSKHQEKVKLQFHDASVNVSNMTNQPVTFIHMIENFPLKFFATLAGDCDARTGVPPSLCTVTAEHFLTKKALVKVNFGRPFKFNLEQNVVEMICLVSRNIENLWDSALPKQKEKALVTSYNFSCFSLTTKQVVAETKSSDSSARLAFAEIYIDLQSKNETLSCLMKAVNTTLSLSSISENYFPLFFPFTVSAALKMSSYSNPCFVVYSLSANFSLVHVVFSAKCFRCLTSISNVFQSWVNELSFLHTSTPDVSSPTDLSKRLTKIDDLRTGAYTYITSEDCELLPGNIVFCTKLPISTMSWCYDKPHCVKHVRITPIPFNEVVGDYSDILCTLQSYCDARESYITQKKFFLSETQHVDFKLFDDEDTSQIVVSAKKWRVCIHNTNTCCVSPLSLAASMVLESIFDPKYVPSFTAAVQFEQIKSTFFIEELQNETESCLAILSDVNALNYIWKNTDIDLSAEVSASAEVNLLEYCNFTWLPLLLPVHFDLNVLSCSNSSNISCMFKDIVDIYLSQRIVHSLQFLTSHLISVNQKHNHSPRLILRNCSNQTLLIGQALTNECISLKSGSELGYSWYSAKTEPKLHVSVDGLSVQTWSTSFSVNSSSTFTCVIDDTYSVVVNMDCSQPWTHVITFSGKVRIINKLPVDVVACLLVKGKMLFSRKLCSTKEVTAEDLLLSLSELSTLSFEIVDLDYKPSKSLFVSDLVDCINSSQIIQFSNSSGEMIYAQVCYYQENFIDVLAVLPLFIVCSFLPDPAILHVETRCLDKFLKFKLKGCGEQLFMGSLSPHNTHHLKIQLNEHETPFDVTVPIHFSLTHTLNENMNFSNGCNDLSQHFPFNDPQYEAACDEEWEPGDGSVQARLSLHHHSLMVEIIPWCILFNKTNIVLCLTSPHDMVTIIQPGQMVVPHHFSGLFHICTTNSTYSDWLTLGTNTNNKNPSKEELAENVCIPLNGSQTILLRKESTILEMQIQSCIHHGIRVITLFPKWWFVNLSEKCQNLKVLPTVKQHACELSKNSVEVGMNSFVPLFHWQIEESVQSITENENVSEESNIYSVVEQTTSSFLCVENIAHESFQQSSFADKVLCIYDSEFVSFVSLEDNFFRKLVDFHLPSQTFLHRRLILTKHEYNDSFYLVLTENKKEKYVFHNLTTMSIHVREVTEDIANTPVILLPSFQSVQFESYLDTELFPRCTRQHRTLKMQICEAEDDCIWTDFLISATMYDEKIFLQEEKLIFMHVKTIENCIHVYFCCKQENKGSQQKVIKKSFTGKVLMNEMRVVLKDDLNNPTYSVDVMQVCLKDILVEMSFCIPDEKWLTKVSLLNFQLDNHLLSSSDFPVFLSTSVPNEQRCSIMLCASSNFVVDEVEISLKPLELQCEKTFGDALANLLQSYVDIAHSFIHSTVEHSLLPKSVVNETEIFSNPLRFHVFVIHPFTLLISIRTPLKLHLTIDHGCLSFSKFACRDANTTFNEFVQELTRHYFAEVVYGAGWVIGSLDLLGNPASTIRGFAQGISDFIVLPYQGLLNGPSAFVGGLTRGFSSLLCHFSAGTLRSVTNIASGISRNLDYGRSYNKKDEEALLMLTASKSELGSSKLSAELQTSHAAEGYVSGVTKLLVGVVTKPIGGAAGIVSKTGESILRRVGLEEQVLHCYKSTTVAISSYQRSLTKYADKLIQGSETLMRLVSINCQIVCFNQVKFPASLIMTPTTLYIIQLQDDSLEASVSLDEIEMHIDTCTDVSYCTVNICLKEDDTFDKIAPSSEKVAQYLGMSMQTETTANESTSVVKYVAQVNNHSEAQLFLAIFELFKPKTNRFSC